LVFPADTGVIPRGGAASSVKGGIPRGYGGDPFFVVGVVFVL